MQKVALIGTGPTWDKAPFNEEGWEYWSLNDFFRNPLIKKKATRFFGMDHREKLEALIPGLIVNYNVMKIPIYMQKHWDDIPCSIEYPLDHMISKFGKTFTSSFAYMFALAMDEGFTTIGFYGVHMDNYDEYWQQRYGLYKLKGHADNMGIKIIVPEGCPLFEPEPLYGYENDGGDNFFVINRKYLEENLTILKQEEDRLLKHLDFVSNGVIGYQELIKKLKNEKLFVKGVLPQ